MEVAQYTEKLVPSTRIVAVDNVAPTLADPTGSLSRDVGSRQFGVQAG